MTTANPSAALMPAEPVFSNRGRLALAAFLAGYSGLTREAYALDLRQFASWCQQHHLRLAPAVEVSRSATVIARGIAGGRRA